MKKRPLLFLSILWAGLLAATILQAGQARNPVIWADVPDPSVIRVGDTYYMSSTTMHMSPGLPIMKDGDVAGLAAFQRKYGFVGVRMEGNARYIVMVSAGTETPEELETIPMSGNTVHLKVDCDFKSGPEKAYFYYSIDGKEWTPIGKPLQMVYTLPHFMGYRFGLFQFATKTAGGYVDFDYFRIDNAIEAKD